MSKPCFPDMSGHHLWKVRFLRVTERQTWDAVVEEFLHQLFQSQACRKGVDVISRDVERVTAAPSTSDGVDETHDPYAHIRKIPSNGANAGRVVASRSLQASFRPLRASPSPSTRPSSARRCRSCIPS